MCLLGWGITSESYVIVLSFKRLGAKEMKGWEKVPDAPEHEKVSGHVKTQVFTRSGRLKYFQKIFVRWGN